MIKTSSTKYVKIKRFDLYGTPCIPTGQVREVAGQKQAEFLCIYTTNPERKVWLFKDEIM